MSLLDGAIRELFGEVFGAEYLEGVLVKTTLVDDGLGGWSTTSTSLEIAAQLDAADESMRREPGYTATDAKLIILQDSLAVTLTTGDKVTLDGRSWLIASVASDPAASHWVARGQLARTEATTGVSGILWGGAPVLWGGSPLYWGNA